MYKIMIVDDEMFIYEHLRSIINDLDLNCEVVGFAENAEIALERLFILRPDIIICDIQMHGKNGLELAAEVNIHFPECKIIFLSGHDKFSYAQEAIRNNAVEYLLKPVDPNEMFNALEKTICLLDRHKKLQRDSAMFNRLFLYSKETLRESFLQQIAYSFPQNQEDAKRMIEFFELKHECYYAAIVEVESSKENVTMREEYEIQSQLYSLKKTLLEQLRMNSVAYLLNAGLNRFLIVLLPNCKVDILLELEHSLDYVRNLFGISISCGVSNLFTSLVHLNYYHQQAIRALMQKNVIGLDDVVICYRHVVEICNDCFNELDYMGEIDSIVASLIKDNLSRKELTIMIGKVLSSNCHHLYNDKDRQSKGFELAVFLSKALETSSLISRKDVDLAKIYKKIISMKTIEETSEYLACVVENLIVSNRKNSRMFYNRVVQDALRFLELNYRNNIRLSDVADAVYVNQSYLSRLIKRITGRNYVDILTGIRVDKSRELLRRNELKVYEIAQQVGISDTKYFSFVFKKETGYTPTEYRNIII